MAAESRSGVSGGVIVLRPGTKGGSWAPASHSEGVSGSGAGQGPASPVLSPPPAPAAQNAAAMGWARSVAGGNDPRALDHQDHGALGRARPMPRALRHDEAVPWRQVHRAILEVDEKAPGDDVEELVLVI